MAVNPFSQGPTGPAIPPSSNQYLTGQQQQQYDLSMTGNEEFSRMVQQAAALRKKKTLLDMLKQQEGKHEALGKNLPNLQRMQERMKLEDGERKLKKLRLDMMTKESAKINQEQQKQQQEQQKQQQGR